MNGVPIKVISMEKGVMVSHPKGHSLVRTNEETFRACYEWSLLLSDFNPAKAELNGQSHQMDDTICAQIQTELVLDVLEGEFASPLSEIPKATTPLAARASLNREMFRRWDRILMAHRKLRDYFPCRLDVSYLLTQAMLGVKYGDIRGAYGMEVRASL
jgi:hypothetical protein